MKTYSNSLNRIFKRPLYKALFIVCMFLSFLFVRTVNSEKVEAGDCANYETTYTSPSGGTYSNGVFTITNESQAIMYVHLEAKSGVLFHLYVYVDDVLVLDKGSEYVAAWNMYCNNYPRIYIGSNITSKSIGYLDHEDYFYTDVKLPYSLVKHNSTVKVKAERNLGGFREFSFTVKDGKGPTAPTVNNPYANMWAKPGYTISWSGSSDSFSGLSKYQYTNIINGSNDGWKDLPSGGSDTWSAERNNNVCFRGVDKAGNGGSQTCTRVKIDNTSPSSTIAVTNSSSGNWTNQDVSLTLKSGADLGTYQSGFSKYQYSYDGSYWQDGSGWSKSGNTWVGTWSAERNNTVYFRVCDVAGWCSAISSTSTTVKIDKTSPSSSVTIANSSSGNWTNQNVTITVSGGADTGTVKSGFSKYQYSYDKSTWYNDWSSSGTTTKGVWSVERNNTIYFRVVDVAGNVSAVSSSTTNVKIDKTNPGQPSLTNSSSGNWTNQNVTITVSGGADTGTYQSGFSKYQYSSNNSSWSDTVTKSFTSEQNSTRYYRSCDVAGNCSTSKSTTIKIDKTNPGQPSLSNSSSGNWTNQNVTITVSGGADTGTYQSGFSKYQYSSNNSSWSDTVTKSFTSEMNATRYYRACDAAGNCSTSKSTTIKIDKTNPTMSSVSNTSGGGWTNQDVTLTPSGGADTGTYQSGFSKYQYSTNNSSWSSTLTTAFSAEQNSTYYYRPCDVAGNCGASMSSSVKIDKTKPSGTISVSSTSGGSWTNQNVTVTVKGATDPLSNGVSSGLKQYDWTSGSSWTKFYTQSNITDQTNGYAAAMWSGETDFTLTPRVCDNAGNCLTGTATTKVRIDKTNPNGSLTIANTSSSNWTNQDVTLTISGATDTAHASVNSGISYYQFSYDGTNWAAKSELGDGTGHYNTSTGAKDTWSAERDNTVYFRACDLAGNCTKYSQTTKVRIDKTNPTFTLSNTSGGSWTNQNVTLTPSAGADTGTYQSGFSIYQYSTNNSSWSTVTAGKSYSAEQNSTYYFRACDVAGNCISKSSAVKIDKTKPSQPGITNSSSGNWTNKDVTLTATGGADTGTYQSGFSHYQYSTNNSSWSTLSTTTYTTEQNKTYYYRACDNAGNCGSSKSSNVKIDKSEPVGTIKVDKNAKTATIEITDAWSIATSESKVGSNYKYFLSKELNLTKAQVQAIPDDAWLSPEATGANGTTIPMNVSSGKYYLYVKVSNTIKDSATNTVAIKGLDDQYSYYTTKGNYVIYRQLVDINSNKYDDDSSSFDEDDMNKEMNGSIASLGAQVMIMDRIIMVTFANEATLPDGFTMVTINNVLNKVGYKLVTVDRSKTYDFEGSYPFEDVLIAKLDANNKASEVEVMDLIVIITAPQVGNSGASTNVIEQGEEIGNVSVSFISDVEFNVEKEIIHNGVKVNKIDTNNPGVYEVRYTAIDVMGRVNKVKRTLVVKEGVKEEVEVKVEEIKETPEVITPVVVNNAPVEVQPEVNTNRKVVENVQVEMRIENKDEIKGYKKRKEVKEEKKSDLTFKLFSKWFFKVYDG